MQITITARKGVPDMPARIPAPVPIPRNALLIGIAQPSPQPAPSAPEYLSSALASAIGHAALLSDTPEKWASTVDMLKQSGIDPRGYEDFEKGRLAAMAAAGTQPPQADTE
jgi:hypothetical protein